MPENKPSSFAMDASKIGGAAAVAQVVGLLLYPMLARIYGPAAFGVFNAYSALVMILGTICCLRYEMAIVLPEKDEDAAVLLWACVGLTLLVSLLTAVLIWTLNGPLQSIEDFRTLSSLSWCVPLGVLFYGINMAQRFWHTRRRRFGALASSRLGSSVVRETGKLAYGVGLAKAVGKKAFQAGNAASIGLIASDIAAYGLASLMLLRSTWKEDKTLLLTAPMSRMGMLLKRYHKFPLINTWGAFMNILSRKLPNLYLPIFFSKTIGGWYGAATLVVEQPMTLIGDAVRQVFMQRAAVECNEKGAPTETVSLSFGVLFSLGIGPFAVLAAIAPFIFGPILGANWVTAGAYIRWLAPWLLIVFITSPLMPVTSIMERQGIGLVFQVIKLALRVVALLIGGVIYRDPLVTVIWLSALGIVGQGIMLFWIMHLARVPVKKALWRERGTILSTLGFALLFLLSRAILGPSALWALGLSALFTALYIAQLWRRFDLSLSKLKAMIPGRR